MNGLGPLLLSTSSVMATFRQDLIVSAARYWVKLGLVVVVTPGGRKLKRCGYVGDVDYTKHSTWLQVPVMKPLSLHPPQIVNLLHDKLDPFVSVCMGIINVDDMSFHENTLAIYSGGVSEVVSHLRYTLSAPPPIPCPEKPLDKDADAGLVLQKDFDHACKNLATLQATLPFAGGRLHPFHLLRSVDDGRLTFHHCLTNQPKIVSGSFVPLHFRFSLYLRSLQ